MKFDFVIGNPPYQIPQDSNNRQEPIYPYFYDIAKEIADKYILISPARFLFNAGLTSKDWNKSMLTDKHLKVNEYFENATEIFANTDIKGGVAIMYRDISKDYGEIDEFIPDITLRRIVKHIKKSNDKSISSIMSGGRSTLKFNELCISTYPTIIKDRLKAIQEKNPNVNKLAPNEEYEIKSSSFDVLPYVFHEKPTSGEECYKFLGLKKGKREHLYVEKKFLSARYLDNNINYYKVFIPKASGSGKFGEVLSLPELGIIGETSTPTFISIGKFETKEEAVNVLKYIKTKFARALLSVLKITQDIVPSKWKYVPLQDFTDNSDIDWSQSISDIDKQLYKKYNLSDDEIEFIETNVKEME